MSQLSRTLRLFVIGVAVGFLLLIGGFGISRALAAGKVLGDVRVAGVQLGGLTAAEATDTLEALEAELLAIPVKFVVNGEEPALEPIRVGFALDADAIVEDAMSYGRDGDISAQFRWWLSHFVGSEDVGLQGEIDPEATAEVIAEWNSVFVSDPPFPGAVVVEETQPVPRYPKTGRHIDPDTAPDLILGVLLRKLPNPTSLPVIVKEPRLTEADVDAAVSRARLWLSAPVTLRDQPSDTSVTFSVEDLADAFRSTVDDDGLVLGFDPDAVEKTLERARSALEMPPVDARFEIEGDEIRIVPGRPGTLIDPVATAEALETAAASSTRTGVLPFEYGAQPEVTTEALEALGIRHLVSSFTTYHDCCGNRVTNIHLFADTIDDAIVLPGESLELNEYVGERTTEKGYLMDGTIVQGELVATVGGGVSQFATTFYNAVFWGGYEDVTHTPHSFYFSRYPEGIEATISWPLPKLEFRNDSEAAILIDTQYTDTSITVRFFGDNDGRIVVGEQVNGSTNLEVVAEGGPNARRVSAEVSGRFNFTEPTIEYRENPELAPDEQEQIQKPAPGWTVIVTRTIEQARDVRIDEWTVRYSPKREIIEVHPCMMPDTEETCPTTTTSSTSTTSTTTTTSEP